jgi:bifunctional non-homologous end joining protein LigD
VGKKIQQLSIDGRRISVSNLDKVLYPAGKFTKADVIDYYIRVSKYLLPQLRNHEVTQRVQPKKKSSFFAS